jgi:putative acetyltransferase
MSLTIERAAEATREVHDLIEELNAVLGAVYEAHQRHGLAIEQLFEPNVRFFVARLDGLVVGCGGVAMLDDYAEVKRMYTRPVARGRGIAKAVLYKIEDEARGAGKSVLRLETGTYQQEAIGLYEAMGFQPTGPFGPYVNACPQHRGQPLFRKGARIARMIRPERPVLIL